MKRSKNINREKFRKSWRYYRLAPLALSMSAVFILTGCEQTDETVAMYQNADDCSNANPSKENQCAKAYHDALKEAERTAPKYASRADCVAEFGENQCIQPSTSTPALAQAGETTATAAATEGSSPWMPLLAGYMMGRLMGGGGSPQPLFTSQAPNSPANGKFVDASGKSYGAATPGRTMTVTKTAMAPKPTVTNTITRGGFGKSVVKQASMQRKNERTSSSSRVRSMGS